MSVDFSYQKHFLDLQIIRSRFGSYFCAISEDVAQSPNEIVITSIKLKTQNVSLTYLESLKLLVNKL